MEKRVVYFIGILSSLLGIVYLFFVRTESEVHLWGLFALLAGIIILIFLPKMNQEKRTTQLISLLGFLLLSLAQIPAIYLWTSSALITDGPEGIITLRWGIIPHLLLLSLTLWMSLHFLHQISRRQSKVV